MGAIFQGGSIVVMENSIHVRHYNQLNRLAALAAQFECQVNACDQDGNTVNAKSIISLLSLNLKQPIRLISDNPAALRILSRELS